MGEGKRLIRSDADFTDEDVRWIDLGCRATLRVSLAQLLEDSERLGFDIDWEQLEALAELGEELEKNGLSSEQFPPDE